MPLPRRLLLLRHGETQSNLDGIWQGHLDVALTARGLEQAAAAARCLAAYEPALVVSSDLQRAAHTAEVVAAAVGRAVELDARWREFDVGQWQGLTSAQVIARHPEQRLAALRGENQRRGIDGEGPAEVRARVAPALTELVERLGEGRSAVVVSHGGTIRVLASVLLCLDSPTVTRLFTGPGNCRWADLVQTGDHWRVAGWNLHAADLGNTGPAG